MKINWSAIVIVIATIVVARSCGSMVGRQTAIKHHSERQSNKGNISEPTNPLDAIVNKENKGLPRFIDGITRFDSISIEGETLIESYTITTLTILEMDNQLSQSIESRLRKDFETSHTFKPLRDSGFKMVRKYYDKNGQLAITASSLPFKNTDILEVDQHAINAAKEIEEKAIEEEERRNRDIDIQKEQQRIRYKGTKAGQEKVVEVIPGLEITICWIPLGEFTMGSPKENANGSLNQEQRKVVISDGFWMSKYEVTQFLWKSVMGSNPSKFSDYENNHPVEQVTKSDILRPGGFIDEINSHQNQGMKFRLPTQAEWEYACRAGTTTDLNSNKDILSEDTLCPNLNEVAWYELNSYRTNPVGKKRTNAWGLYDMHGNVSEICEDRPENPYFESYQIRGGSWRYSAKLCHSSSTNQRFNTREPDVGFRLVLMYSEAK